MENVFNHFPFIAFALCMNAAGVVSRRFVPKVHRGFPLFFWRTRPLHPVVLGVLFGLVPGMPVSVAFGGKAAACLYYGTAGVVSTWVYAVVRQAFKRFGYELPGSSFPPAGPS